MSDDKNYYLTTPIYYVNAAPHIGHAYTTFAAETIARLKRMQGYHVVLTTGTDEHGTKVERAAQRVGKSPQDYTDLISNEFRQQWQTLGLAIDRFQRTTAPNHHAVVQDMFRRCFERGYIYKGTYTGLYSVVQEAFVNDAQPGDIDPETGKPYETVTEENYFFKLSDFTGRLLDFYEQHPDFIQPEIRRNEVIAFVKQGLADLSITRTSITWGIPVPKMAEGERDHVFYVWFDALNTYRSAVEGEDRWPADLHLIGKEILRFHAVFWPAFLMAADLPLPKQVFAHGWLLFENDKMSKSRGNIVRATPIHEVMGADALRYFLLREVVFGQDGSFSFDALVQRYNSDLANGLGNLASRTLTMIRQYRAGRVPDAGDTATEVQEAAAAAIRDTLAQYERFEFSQALTTVWSFLSVVDRYIVQQAPWKLAKDESQAAALNTALYTIIESLRIATVLLAPVLPKSAEMIWRQLGLPGEAGNQRLDALVWGQMPAGHEIGTIEMVFPRLDPKVVIERMKELEQQESQRQAELVGAKPAEPAPAAEATAATPAAPALKEGMSAIAPEITIDDFMKVDLRVGLVLSAEPVKGADKLLHLKIDLGEAEPRTILAGLAQYYQPETLVNRKVVVVANLAPRKMRGIMSQGMVCAASLENTNPVLAGFLEDVPVGARLK